MVSISDDFIKYTIRISDSASKELAEIYEYVKNNAYELAAHRQESLIIKRIRQLDVFPNGYPIVESNPPLRSLRAGRYRIFFLVNDNEQAVEIVHIVHSRRDMNSVTDM